MVSVSQTPSDAVTLSFGRSAPSCFDISADCTPASLLTMPAMCSSESEMNGMKSSAYLRMYSAVAFRVSKYPRACVLPRAFS